MVFSASVNLVLVVTAALMNGAHAHSYMILPLPTWPVSWATNSPSGTIEGDDYLPLPDGMSYSSTPLENTEAYWTAFNASEYTSLRDFLTNDTQVLQSVSGFGTGTVACGFSLANGTARDLPSEVEWEQLTSSHEGPFEIWCDDTLVFEDWNAAADYTSSPAVFPYDLAKCEGASMLTSYWLALHQLPWQVYTNCAPLTGDYSSSVDASAIEDDDDSTESASLEGEASYVDSYTTSEEASESEASESEVSSSATVSTASTSSTTASATSAASAEYSAASEDSSSSSTSTTISTTTASTDASTGSGEATEAPATTTTTPTATTAAPSATTATPTATSVTSADKCSVRQRRN